jgi:SAM-dependent methyltransferase
MVYVESVKALSIDLVDLLACPRCRGPVAVGETASSLACTACGLAFADHDGIPLLLLPSIEARDGDDDVSTGHKERQIAFFDQDSVDDFGITRPRGAPELYGWLLEEKFRRSIIGLDHLLPGSTVLTICGGSGIDADFLARRGAHVILSDIAVGVVLQARERARRFGLDLELVVADAEALPFADASVDMVYVHDGLHHLERPALALAEMARVARHAISITEPAHAFATSTAVRLGLADRHEEAGNPVRRLTLDELTSELTARGFQPISPQRYAMYYHHWPGRAVRLLSHPVLLPLAKAAFGTVNRVAGRFGNKLAVQAVRASD